MVFIVTILFSIFSLYIIIYLCEKLIQMMKKLFKLEIYQKFIKPCSNLNSTFKKKRKFHLSILSY